MPDTSKAEIRSRSGLSLKGIIVLNSPGTIDPDYKEEIKVILRNRNKTSYKISQGDKVAQLIFKQNNCPEIKGLVKGNSQSRNGGFGSTDRKFTS